MTKAYKINTGSKTDNNLKWMVWAEDSASAIQVFQLAGHGNIQTFQHMKNADNIQPGGTILPWTTYLQKEAELNDRERQNLH